MWKKFVSFFKKQSAKTFAVNTLEESHRQFLLHESCAAYHSKIAEYYAGNIQRLGLYIKKA